MVNKVKITKEQVDAIEYALNPDNKMAYANNPDKLLESHIESSKFISNLEPLRRISAVDLAKALYIGYEVEPQFKVGDWVIWKTKFEETLVKINYKSHQSDGTFRFNREEYDSEYIIRHATSQEIKAEKERELWKKNGREIGEFRQNDIIMNFQDMHQRVFTSGFVQGSAKSLYIDGELKGYYPAESFVSFEETQ